MPESATATEQEQQYAAELHASRMQEQAVSQQQAIAQDDEQESAANDQQQGATDQAQRRQSMVAMARQAVAQAQESGMSDREMRQEAKQLTKRYKITMESLKKDLDMEWGAFGGGLYFPVMLALLATSDFINFITFGTIWTLVNWIIGVTMPIVRVQRAWTKAAIMYASAERQVQRRLILYQRGIWNTTKKTIVSSISWVPIVNMIPVPTFLVVTDRLDEKKHQAKLKALRERARMTEQRINRLQTRARSGQAQYHVAFLAIAAVKKLDDAFLKV